MDALELLTADHNRVRGLFARFEKAHESEDAEQMQVLAAKIVEELTVHTAIEEEIFYPSVRDYSGEVRELVDEGIQEHHVVKTLIDELATVEPGGDEWQAKMTVITENVEHHAAEEEQEMFPKIRSASNATTRDELGQRLEAKKVELGAPVAADNADATVEQLREKASEQEIPGRSSMDRDELAATVDPRG